MKKEKPLSKEEIIFKFLGEIAQNVREKKGVSEPKQLPNGDSKPAGFSMQTNISNTHPQ